MGTGIQDFLVYGIVLLAVIFLLRKWRRTTSRSGCGDECGCAKGGVKRNPVIEKYLKKHD